MEATNLVVGTSGAAKKAGGELIDDAMELEDVELAEIDGIGGGGKGGKGGKGSNAGDYDVGDALRAQAARAGRGEGPRAPCCMTAATLEAMIDTIGDFFKRQPAGGKCQNCGAHNPTIKK